MYKYNTLGKLISIGSVALLIVMIYISKNMFFDFLFTFATVFMIKDAISVFTTNYQVTEEGFYKKDIFKTRELCNWHNIEYITITKKNKKWIAITLKDGGIKYIKQHIDNRRELLLEIIEYAKKNKHLAIHDYINNEYNLGLTLDDRGRIKKQK